MPGQPPPPGPPGPEFPAPAVGGQPPPPLPPVIALHRDGLISENPGPLGDLALERGLAGVHAWPARVSVSPSQWSVATLLHATGPARTSPLPGGGVALLEEAGLSITAAAVPADSLPDAPPGTPLLSRARMLHRRLLPQFAGRPVTASWQRLGWQDAVLDLLTQPAGGRVTGFSLAAESGPGALVVVGSAPPDRDEALARVALPLATLASGGGGTLRWAALPGWTLAEEAQITMPSVAAGARLVPLPRPDWGVDEWTDHVLARGPFRRDLREHADRRVRVRGLTEARLRRFDWQPMMSGRLLTTVVAGVTDGHGFTLVVDVPLAGEDLLLDVDALLELVEVRPAEPPQPIGPVPEPAVTWPAPVPLSLPPLAPARPSRPAVPPHLPTWVEEGAPPPADRPTGPVPLPARPAAPAGPGRPPGVQRWTESRIAAPVPDGWFVKESLTLLAPDGQGNVIVSREPLDPSLTTEQYAARQGELLRREFPHFEEISFGELPLSGGTALLRRFSWTPPDGVRVTQHQVYLTASGTGFTATATSPSTTAAHHAPAFEAVLRSLRFGAHPAPPALGDHWPPPVVPLGSQRTYAANGHGELSWEASPDDPERVARWAERRLRAEIGPGVQFETHGPRSWTLRIATPQGLVVRGVSVDDVDRVRLPPGVTEPVPEGTRCVLQWSTGTFAADGRPPSPPPPPPPTGRRRWGWGA